MSTVLNSTFNEILTKDGNIFFVDKLWVKSLGEGQWAETLDLHSRLKLASDEQAGSFFRIDVKQLTSEKLIQSFLGESHVSNAIDASDYQALTDAFSKLKPGVVIFYRTHLISSDVLRLLSKLIKHIQEQNLEWKFVFYGKAKKLTHITKDRLFIEYFYPEEYKYASQISKKAVNDSAQSDGSVKRFGFLKGVLAVFALAIIGTLIYLVGERPSSTLDNQRTINDVAVGVNQDKKNEPSQLQSGFKSNQTLKEMIRESKLQALEFEKTMAEINATQVVEASSNEGADKSEPIKTANDADKKASLRVNTIRLLSSELEQAIVNNDLAFLESFNDQSMFTSGRNSKGETPLIVSVNNGSEEIVRWLLQKNVPVDSRDSYGRTALFYSAIKGNENFVRQLVQADARVSLGSSLSKTPLMAAVHNNHYESAELLLGTRKVNVNARDHSGWSALFYAVWNSNSQMANLLLEFGANVNLVDNSGLNIDQIAGAAGFDEWQNRNQ